jgi:DNA-3-methyladenine glycosylase II
VTADDYARARRLLLRRDPVLAELIRKHGPCGLAAAQRADHFSALVRAITGQQLSTKAAATIYGRLAALMPGGVTPEALAALSDDQMRAVGVSRQKAAYFRDLCEKVLSGALPLHAPELLRDGVHDAAASGRNKTSLDTMSDEEVIAALTQVKGIGRWSAEMFLIFRLHRPDVLPVGDLGIVNAVKNVYRLRKPPTPERIRKIGAAWQPYRSVASWYLWRSLDNE